MIPVAASHRRTHFSGMGAIALLALPLCLLPGQGCSLPDDTAALVNGKPIPASSLEDALDEFNGQFGELTPPGGKEMEKAKKVLLDRLIETELMMQEVSARKLQPTAAEVDDEMRRLRGELSDEEFDAVLADAGLSREQWRDRIGRDISLERLQRAVVGAGAPIPDGQVDEYLATHRIDLQVPEQIRASQILLRTKEEALDAEKRIARGESFADVARAVSLSPDSGQGGDIGYFGRGQMPQEFDAVVFSLPVGKVSAPVETAYGFHLFLVTDRRDARQRDEQEAREEIRALLYAEQGERLFKEWLAGRRAAAEIRYNSNIAH